MVQDANPPAYIPQPTQPTYPHAAFWGLLLLTAAIRLIAVTRPLLGNFATKSVMYAMIARNWAEGRAGILYPTLDCLVGGKRGLHMLEFSVSAYVTGALWKLFGGSLDVWGRATAVAFSVASVALLYGWVRRRHGATAGLAAGFMLAVSPIGIVYGQNFMLDASLIFFTVAAFYCFDRWLDGGTSAWLAPACAAFGLLLLSKVYLVVLLLPLGAMVAWPKWFAPDLAVAGGRALGEGGGVALSRGHRRLWVAACVAVAAVLPVVLWSVHAMRTAAPGGPFAAHIYSSLQGNATSYRPPDPLLGTADFYRQMLDDLTTVILTPIGFTLALVGLWHPRWRQHAPWLLAMGLLVLALARKFHAMNYYEMVLLPPLCVLVGLGWQLIARHVRPGRWAVACLLAATLTVSLRYAVRPAFVTPAEDRAVVAAGRAIEMRTEKEEPVATMHGATIDLLYYCNRPGWAIAPDTPDLAASLERCRLQGATYLVVAGPEATGRPPAALALHALEVEGDGFRIYRLEPPIAEGSKHP